MPEQSMCFWGGLAGYQILDAIMQLWIVYYIEQPAAAVLAAFAFWRHQRALLVHVSENGISVAACGHSDFGMIPFGFSHTLETERLSLPGSRRRDFDWSWLAE